MAGMCSSRHGSGLPTVQGCRVELVSPAFCLQDWAGVIFAVVIIMYCGGQLVAQWWWWPSGASAGGGCIATSLLQSTLLMGCGVNPCNAGTRSCQPPRSPGPKCVSQRKVKVCTPLPHQRQVLQAVLSHAAVKHSVHPLVRQHTIPGRLNIRNGCRPAAGAAAGRSRTTEAATG